MTTPAFAVAFATSASGMLDESWPLLAEAFSAAGCTATVRAWSDTSIPWSSFDAVVVSYAWDYTAGRDAFVGWAEAVGTETTIVNTLPVLRWNSEKTYLADLAADGVPIVPTDFVAPGSPWRPPPGEFVVKPAVANGGLEAARYADAHAPAVAHVARLHAAGHVALIQPYLRRVDDAGETALIFLDGAFSHAVTKQPLLRADAGVTERLYEHHEIAPAVPRPDQLATAEQVVSAAHARHGDLAYARVDLLDDEDGRPCLLELEAVEPALYVPDTAAAGRLATAVLRQIAAARAAEDGSASLLRHT